MSHQYSRHHNNIVGKTLLMRVRESVMEVLIKTIQATRLRADPQLLSVPTCWGPPEIRLHFFYAEQISAREVRIVEVAGANFFTIRYLCDGCAPRKHHLPVALSTDQQNTVCAAIHQFFMEGTYTWASYEQLVEEGYELRASWINAVEAEPV